MDLRRRVRDREQLARGLVDATSVACADRMHGDQQFERRRVFEFGRRMRIGAAEAREYLVPFGRVHALLLAAISVLLDAGALSMAAAMMACLRCFSASSSGVAAVCASTSLQLGGRLGGQARVVLLPLALQPYACAQSWRARAASACSCDQASQPVRPGVTATMAMQSTGQGATHRSQPVHRSAARCASAWRRRRWRRPGRPGCTACSRCRAPRR